jgi:uncharacterized Zn ribbon protein
MKELYLKFKRCIVCEKNFVVKNQKHIFCSVKCRQEWKANSPEYKESMKRYTKTYRRKEKARKVYEEYKRQHPD